MAQRVDPSSTAGSKARSGSVRPVHPSLHALAWIVVFAVAVGAGAAIHLDHPLSRRLVAASVNRILASVLVGHVTIDRIRGLSPWHLGGVDAHVDDAKGRTVLRVEGAEARVSAWTLIRTLVTSPQDIVVDVPELSAANVQVDLQTDPDGSPRIAKAFAPRETPRPSASASPLHVRLNRVTIARASFHARPGAPVEGEIEDLEGGVRVESGVTAIDVHRGRITAQALPHGPVARVDIEGRLTVPALHIQAILRGSVGGVGERAELTYDDGRVDAVVDVPRTAPEVLRSVWPSSPIAEPVDLHAEAHGTLPRLDVVARTGVGATQVGLHGPVEWKASGAHGELVVQADAIDLRTFAPSLPRSNVTASADVSFAVKPAGDLSASASIDLAAGDWGAMHLPAAAIRADVALPAGGLPTANATIDVREPGAPATVTGHLAPEGTSLALSFALNATVPRLEDVSRIRGLLHGSLDASATGAIDFGNGTIAAQLTATGVKLQLGGTTMSETQIQGRVRGALVDPAIDVDVAGDDLRSGPLGIATFRATGRVSGGRGLTVRNVDVEATGEGSATREGSPAHAQASLIVLAAGRLRVDDMLVEGLGAPLAGTLRASSEGVVVQAKSAGLDLPKCATFLNMPLTRGTASVDVDATIRAGAADGRLALEVKNAALYGIRDAGARLEVVVEGRSVSGRADARIEDIGTLAVRSSAIDIGPGPLVTAAPWRRTWGALDFDAHVDLDKLFSRLPRDLVPIARAMGDLDVDGRVARDSIEDATPGVDVRVRTKGLTLDGRGSRSWHVEGFDPTVHVTVDGDTGATLLAGELPDAHGPLFKLRATSTQVPYAVLFSDENPAAALRAMPFDATLEVPSRSLEPLSSTLGIGGIGGTGSAKLTWRGSVVSPTIDVTAQISEGRLDPTLISRPIDAAVDGHYDGTQAHATLRVLERNTEVLRAQADVDARASDVLAAFGGAPPVWSASARASLDKMPLHLLSPLYDRQVQGTATGEITLEGLHRDARAGAALTLDGLQVADVACRSATARVAIDGHAFDAQARIDHTDGFVEASAHFGARWGAALTPSIDLSSRAHASLSAKQFRAAILLPFVTGAFAALDGRIDASARVDLDPGANALRPQGSLELKNGTFELPSFGNEFRDAGFKLALTPDGIVRLENAGARGPSGTVRAAATARFDAGGLAVARATIQMPAKDPLPLVFDGIQLGQLDGQFDVSMDRTGREVDVAVDVPRAHVRLPTGSSSMDVQSLGDVDGVEVGVRRGPDHFAPFSLDTTRNVPPDATAARKKPTKITVRLGRDVRVSRGSGLDVRLEGQPTVILAGDTTVSGQIRLLSGTIDVQGKSFEIEKGTVTFVGNDPSNPQVVLTAGWTAPDGTRVYADFIGPLKTAQAKLRSSPPKSQNEILALILYGTSEEATGSAPNAQSASTSTQVTPFAGAAGSFAAQPLNQALGGVNRMMQNLGLIGGLSTKIDTSQAVARPEVEMQISRDISLQVAWVLGEPPPGTNPDTALVTLDWHFLRKWALETTVGDAGTSILNLVWQQRY